MKVLVPLRPLATDFYYFAGRAKEHANNGLSLSVHSVACYCKFFHARIRHILFDPNLSHDLPYHLVTDNHIVSFIELNSPMQNFATDYVL